MGLVDRARGLLPQVAEISVHSPFGLMIIQRYCTLHRLRGATRCDGVEDACEDARTLGRIYLGPLSETAVVAAVQVQTSHFTLHPNSQRT